MNSAVSTGSFRVWLKNTVSGAWVRITPAASPVAAVPGQTSYSVPWSVSQPVGSYKLWVYYYAADGTTVISTASSSGTVSIALKPTPTITSPNSGSFTQGQLAVGELEHEQRRLQRQLPRLAEGHRERRLGAHHAERQPGGCGARPTSYSVPWLITQPAGSYKLWVYYYAADGTTVLATAVSSGIISVT